MVAALKIVGCAAVLAIVLAFGAIINQPEQ